MSKGYRNGAFAVGLISGVGLTLNLVLWLDYQAKYETDQTSQPYDDPNSSEIGKFWDWIVGTFVSPNDTLAQWIMAILTIAAVILLCKTLSSANQTNIAAIKAANAATESNQIMRNEQRPWVTIEREVFCDIRDSGWSISMSWNYDFVNKGRSPAYDVKLDWKAVKRAHLQGMDIEAEECALERIHRKQIKGIPVVFPSEKTEFRKYVWNGSSQYAYDHSESSEIEDGYLMMFICVTYRLSLNTSEVGAEVIVVGFEDSDRWLHPYGTKMLEYAKARYIK